MNNPAGTPVTIPVGPDNAITGGPAGSLPPEAFAMGQHNAVFAVAIPTGATVRWTLNGQTASASASTPRCSAAVVAQIGVDTFKPFPAPATPSCRYPTPAEVQFPASRLPPAARVNTCTSVAYDYLGRLGFKWRDVDTDAEEIDGQAADAVFALTAPPPAGASSSSSSSGGEVVFRSALFGKIFRKAVQVVGGAVTGAVDGIRRGTRAFAGLFVGSTAIDVTIHPQYTDPDFTPGEMVQAWGQNYGRPISLQGMQLRANRSLFLSVGNLDANNHARVNVLNLSSGARACIAYRNRAGFLTSGFLRDVGCFGTIRSTQPNAQLDARSSDLNIMAQVTDGQLYMTRVAGFTPARAEILVGPVADFIGEFNDDRPFTACFSFSWANDTQVFLTALGVVAANRASEFAVNGIRSGLRSAADAINENVPGLQTALNAANEVAAALSGGPLQDLAQDVAAEVNSGLARLIEARPLITIALHTADDLVGSVESAARKGGGDAAANAVTQQTLDELANAAFPVAVGATQAAHSAVNGALSLGACCRNA